MDQHDKHPPLALGYGARISVEHGAMSSVEHKLRAAVGYGARFTVAQGHPCGPIKGFFEKPTYRRHSSMRFRRLTIE